MQGLDIGSKMKYRGVVIGEVTRISFTYVKYEQDKPMTQRKRYVMVEAQLEPRLVGGRAANDIASPESTKIEVERGLRVHLAPQGITGTNYLELDYVDSLPAAVLPIDWVPDNIYIPSTPSTVTTFVNAASEIVDRLHRLDIETTLANLNKLLTTATDRVASLDTTGISKDVSGIAKRADRTLAEDRVDARRRRSEEAVRRGRRTPRGAAPDQHRAEGVSRQSGAGEAAQRHVGGAGQRTARSSATRSCRSRSRTWSARSAGSTGSSAPGEADLGTTFDNLRQITDNLRDLTEDAKRYPSNLLFGAPPRPLERT